MNGRMILALALMIVFISVSFGVSHSSAQVIQIVCDSPEGCFNMISEQVATASEGAILRVGAGTYYERPFNISENLTIEGMDGDRPVIKLVEDGTGISITPSDPVSGMAVTLQHLEIVTNVALQGEYSDYNIGLHVSGLGSESISQVNRDDAKTDVSLIDVKITAFHALDVTFARMIIQNSEFRFRGIGIQSNESIVDIAFFKLRNERVGTTIPAGYGVLAQDTDINMTGSTVEGRLMGMLLGGDTIYYFEGNSFFESDVAISLAGNFSADFKDNEFALVADTAIQLHLPSCVDNPQPGMDFTLTGSNNKFEFSNGQFICPADYPLPEGFLVKED